MDMCQLQTVPGTVLGGDTKVNGQTPRSLSLRGSESNKDCFD